MAKRKRTTRRKKTSRRRKPAVIKLGKIRRSGKRTKLALKSDRRLNALGPGKRRSKGGKIYYEYRVNRAD